MLSWKILIVKIILSNYIKDINHICQENLATWLLLVPRVGVWFWNMQFTYKSVTQREGEDGFLKTAGNLDHRAELELEP